MTKQTILLSGLLASLVLTGCGGGSSSTPTNNTQNEGSTNIEVERGKVYDANVTDSSNPVKVATMTVGSNVYTFSSTPTYPIKAVGGWIDVDGDGNMTTSDVVNDLNLTSYLKVITPITTYLGDINSTQGKSRLEQLISDMNTTETDLLKVPSKSNKNAIVVQNAIYNVMKTRGTTDIGSHYSDINSSFTTLKTYVDSDPSKITATQISLFAESKVVADLTTSGKITKLDTNKINEIKSKRSGASNNNAWDNLLGKTLYVASHPDYMQGWDYQRNVLPSSIGSSPESLDFHKIGYTYVSQAVGWNQNVETNYINTGYLSNNQLTLNMSDGATKVLKIIDTNESYYEINTTTINGQSIVNKWYFEPTTQMKANNNLYVEVPTTTQSLPNINDVGSEVKIYLNISPDYRGKLKKDNNTSTILDIADNQNCGSMGYDTSNNLSSDPNRPVYRTADHKYCYEYHIENNATFKGSLNLIIH
jgi:hypothetical protein